MKKILVFLIVLGIILTSVGVVSAASNFKGPEGGELTRSGETKYEVEPSQSQVTERTQQQGARPGS